MMRYLVLLASLGVSFFSQAHEVHASNIDVTVQGNSIEILQTTPIKEAQSIAKQLGAENTEHDTTLDAISSGWQIEHADGSCKLTKQAYRLAHHNSQLQMRYLFSCSGDNKPKSLALPWFKLTPEDHFIIMKLTINGKSDTVIFQRQDLVIALG